MRDLEHLMANYEVFYDAWAQGGVDGLVIGPMTFDAAHLLPGTKYVERDRPPSAAFEPDPTVYRRLGVEPPTRPSHPSPDKRRLLEQTLTAAKDRGWSVWIFQASAGAGPRGDGHILADEKSRAAVCARMIDTLEHFPMADGAIMDGPEWGYEIAPHHMNHRSYIFNDLPDSVAPACARLGYDYQALVATKDRLFARLHNLHASRITYHESPVTSHASRITNHVSLFSNDPDLEAWFQFRVDSLTDFYRNVHDTVSAEMSRPVKLGVGPRTSAFAWLCGYDFQRLAELMDVLLPKHYFWHRGFDGLIGTVGRYVETLVDWNPGLSDAEALVWVKDMFGLELPGVRNRMDLEEALTPEFFDQIVAEETRSALAAVGDAERVVPWVDAGRAPHDGDPMTAGHLQALLRAAERAGLSRFLYHHHGNLTAGEWTVISELCGRTWSPLSSRYRPPDMVVL